MIYTAQYRYTGSDRIDVTVKSATLPWKVYAPSWEMVRNYKETRDKAAYKHLYDYDILQGALEYHLPDVLETVQEATDNDLTLVCFCKAGDFCHRVLLAQWFEREWYIPYGGERGLA